LTKLAVTVGYWLFPLLAPNHAFIGPTTAFHRYSLLYDSTRLELHRDPLANHELLADPRIAGTSGLPILHFEDAEIANFHATFLCQDVDDPVKRHLHDLHRFELRVAEFIGDATDNTSFGHGAVLTAMDGHNG